MNEWDNISKNNSCGSLQKTSHFRRSWGSHASQRDESWPAGQGYFWHFSISMLGLLHKALLLGPSSLLAPQTHGPRDSILPRPRGLRWRQTAPSFQPEFLSPCSCTLCNPQSLMVLPDFCSTLSPVLPAGLLSNACKDTLCWSLQKTGWKSQLFNFMLFILLTCFAWLLHLLKSCSPVD